MADPLALYWWNGAVNFGDRLSADVVALVSGRPVVWAEPRACDLFAAGSLMKWVRRSHAEPRADGAKPWLWGTGTLGPIRHDFIRHVRMAAVRGPLTQVILDLDDLPHGDPGLLVPDLGLQVRPTGRIGLVLHHSQKAGSEVAALLAAEPRLVAIDVTEPDHRAVIAGIAGCDHVFSSSLHGLIVADAFGVPSTWLDVAGIHASATFKFYDYALSVGRVLPRPLPISELARAVAAVGAGRAELPHAAGVEAARSALRAAFPQELAA